MNRHYNNTLNIEMRTQLDIDERAHSVLVWLAGAKLQRGHRCNQIVWTKMRIMFYARISAANVVPGRSDQGNALNQAASVL